MADEKGKTRRPGRLKRSVARAKDWADSVLHGPPAPEEEASASEPVAMPQEAAPPSEPLPSEEAAPPGEAAPPSALMPPEQAEPSGPPEHWVREVLSRRGGPPADWVERVRKGAPHLLERMGLRYRLGQIPPEVAASLVAVERPEPAPESLEEEAPSEAPTPSVESLEAGAPRAEPRPFMPVEPPRPERREVAPVPVPQVPRIEPGVERPVGPPVSRSLASPAPKRAPAEAPAPVRAPREEARAEAPAREVEAPRVSRQRAPVVARAPLPPVERAPAMQPSPPVVRAPEFEPPAPEVAAPTGGAVLASAPPMEAERLAYRGSQASAREPTFRPSPAGRSRTEVLRVDVPVPTLAAREARVWPELPEAQGAESVDGVAVLREWERLRRLDREQRGG